MLLWINMIQAIPQPRLKIQKTNLRLNALFSSQIAKKRSLSFL